MGYVCLHAEKHYIGRVWSFNIFSRLTNLGPLKYPFFLIGIALIVFAWLESYPVSIPSVERHVFDSISPIFWPGLSLVLGCLFLICKSSRNKKVKFVCAITLTFFVYIHYLFFPLLPGSDAHYFRGLAKLFLTVGVDPLQQSYFQWPSFFVLNSVLVEILGFSIDTVSILLFLTTGLLFSSSLFVFFSRDAEELGFVGVALYFVGLFWFLNYQFAPQSLALGLFFVLLCLVSRKDLSSTIASLSVFASLAFMHAFIGVLFLLFYFVLTLCDRSRLNSFMLYSVIYLATLVYFTVYYFHDLVQTLANLSIVFWEQGEYGRILQATLRGPVTILDDVARTLSRGVTFSIWGVLLVGFLDRTLKKEIKIHDLSLLVAGSFHFLLGGFLHLLGARALQIMFVPAVSGYRLFLCRYKRIMTVYLLLIFMLFPFISLHQIYDITSVQTASGERASDFMIGKTSMGKLASRILAAREDGYYVYANLKRDDLAHVSIEIIGPDPDVQFEDLFHKTYGSIIYNPSLEKRITEYLDVRIDEVYEVRRHFTQTYGKIFDDGYSCILRR